MYTTPIQLRFNDIDQMGHVNNAVIMEYFDLGKSLYFKAAGVPVTPDEGDFCVMIVHYELSFKKQIRYHDTVEVQTCVSRWGNKSFDLTQLCLCNGEVAVEGKIVMSGYSRSAHAAAPIPEEIKEMVARFDEEH